MALAAGSRLGAYEIVAPLGAGGMGEVYRARDTRLKRDVAIKVLPSAVAADADRLARFQREAEVLAALNHPHIAQVYGVEEGSDATGAVTRALVMELVAGQDLSQRIARGPLPVDDALAIARQIADALEAAHEQGIIHRDLKPANIKVREDGTVKVLDFGLAKAAEPAQSDVLENSPTFTSPVMLTRAGVILGTAAYMSPEQARGREVDQRADIWAFGCVLYEMLVGRAAFAGEGISDTLAEVLKSDPGWAALPQDTPRAILRLLQRCLAKDPKARVPSMAVVRYALEETPQPSSSGEEPTRASLQRRANPRPLLAAAAVLVVSSAAVLIFQRSPGRPHNDQPVIRTVVPLGRRQSVASGDRAQAIAISADGSRLAYVAEDGGRRHLYVRHFSDAEPTLLAGSQGAMYPFFSPDGETVGFAAEGMLQKADLRGGAPVTICALPAAPIGATWGPDGTIVFAVLEAGLWRVPSSGGVAVPIKDTSSGAWPQILPDGHTVLFTNNPAGSALVMIALDGTNRHVIARTTDSNEDAPAILGAGGIAQARYVPGYIVYGQSTGFVRAIPFDLASRSFVGAPVSVVDSAERARNAGAVYYDVSADGRLIYLPTGDRHQLTWVTRQGIETPISADRLAFRIPSVSPDGERVAVCINDERRNSQVWVYDAQRGTKTRITTSGNGLSARWTPDGSRLTFSGKGIAEAAATGGAEPLILHPPDTGRYPNGWSHDNQTLLLNVPAAKTGADVWAFSRASRELRPVLVRPFDDAHAVFSPDDRWIAYMSTESGERQVYVASYPDLATKIPISTAGGNYPVWARSGRELFYRQGDAVMVVDIDPAHGMRPSKPHMLFEGAYTGAGRDASFDVSPDGQRFAMVRSDEVSTLQQIQVIQNWTTVVGLSGQ